MGFSSGRIYSVWFLFLGGSYFLSSVFPKKKERDQVLQQFKFSFLLKFVSFIFLSILSYLYPISRVPSRLPPFQKKRNPKKLNPLPLGLPWFFPHLSTIYFNPYPSRFTHRWVLAKYSDFDPLFSKWVLSKIKFWFLGFDFLWDLWWKNLTFVFLKEGKALRSKNGERKNTNEADRKCYKQASYLFKAQKWLTQEGFWAFSSLWCWSCTYHFLSKRQALRVFKLQVQFSLFQRKKKEKKSLNLSNHCPFGVDNYACVYVYFLLDTVDFLWFYFFLFLAKKYSTVLPLISLTPTDLSSWFKVALVISQIFIKIF